MINQQIEKYLEYITSDEDELLYNLNRETNLRTTLPRMLSGKVQGKFLEFISFIAKPKVILEIGTFTGYSALCLAKGLSQDGKLITIESNKELEDFILKYIAGSDYSEMIELIIGDACKEIQKLDYIFDLVFIDADKSEYVQYFKLVIDKLSPGGIILVDNVLWSGKVVSANPDKDAEAIREFNEFIRNYTGVEQVMLSVRDGLLLIRKTEN